jgi:hypothetical protein
MNFYNSSDFPTVNTTARVVGFRRTDVLKSLRFFYELMNSSDLLCHELEGIDRRLVHLAELLEETFLCCSISYGRIRVNPLPIYKLIDMILVVGSGYFVCGHQNSFLYLYLPLNHSCWRAFRSLVSLEIRELYQML